MSINRAMLTQIIRRKTAIFIILLAVSSFGAFATLGDGKGKPKNKSLLSKRTVSIVPGSFSLKSGYNYRGNQVINQQKDNQFILLNTTITFQKGHTTYILPLKRKVLLDKIKFNPAGTGNY